MICSKNKRDTTVKRRLLIVCSLALEMKVKAPGSNIHSRSRIGYRKGIRGVVGGNFRQNGRESPMNPLPEMKVHSEVMWMC